MFRTRILNERSRLVQMFQGKWKVKKIWPDHPICWESTSSNKSDIKDCNTIKLQIICQWYKRNVKNNKIGVNCYWFFFRLSLPCPSDKLWDESTSLLQSSTCSLGETWAAEISAEYFLILKEIRKLDAIPSTGKTYDQTWDFWEPDAEATAAPARLPMDVFCKIIGRHPIIVGSRKSTMNSTLVAARA